MHVNYKFLSDYAPAPFTIENADLSFQIEANHTEVTSILKFKAQGEVEAPLVLNGETIELVRIELDGKPLSQGQYQLNDKTLTIPKVPKRFTLKITNLTRPHLNKSLEGLYASNGILCTQCEPEGFRKITYFLDRPDVMCKYTVYIEANADDYPILLSNGNCTGKGTKGKRHWRTWSDPFPKPCYLFALVAGKLSCVSSHFVTRSKKRVDLEIYTEAQSIDRCAHAMESLKQSMRWDEKRFGLQM